jgi:hypothetical protein
MKIHITKQSGTSLTDLIDKINASLRKTFRQPMRDEPIFYYPKEVFDDSVIACSEIDGKTYRIAWSIEGEEVKFGEPVEVTESYVEVGNPDKQEAETQVRQSYKLTIKQSLDKEGWAWRFQVVAWGLSDTRHIWRPEVFRQSFADYEWENLGAFADHPTETEMRELPERSIQNKVGWWTDKEITAQGMDMTLHIKPSADWLRQDLHAAYKAGNLDFYGASILVGIQAKQVTWTDQKPATDVERVKPISIDIVTTAAAKGRMKYALASNREQQQGEHEMNKKALLSIFNFLNTDQFESVRQSLVNGGAQGVTSQSTAEQIVEAIHTDEAIVEQALGFVEEATKEPTQTARQARTENNANNDEIPFERLPLVVRQALVYQAIDDSGLEEAVRQSLRKKVTKDTTLNQINTRIEDTREALAVLSQSGQVDNGRTVIVGANSLDKITLGAAKMMGLTRQQFEGTSSYIEQEVRQSGHTPYRPTESEWNDTPEIFSVKRLYFDMTGDHNLQGINSRAYRQGRRFARQSQTPYQTSDFPDLMSNLMHKRVVASFRENDYGLPRVVTKRALDDFKPQIIIVLGFYGDLPVVAENGEYTTYAALTDDKETYSPLKHGKTVDLTIETIANDETKTLRQVPDKMGRAARRTLAKFVWLDCLFSNPTMASDSLALFHASHNNLITDALGNTGLENALGKLLMQTERGSNEKFGFDLTDLTLAVRSDSILKAQTLTDFNQEPGGNTSALDRLLRSAGGRVKINPVGLPFLPDSNDWMVTASNKEADIVEIGYWMGNEEPEFYDMMGETHEKAFNNDVITRHKCRFIFGGGPCMWEPVVKSQPIGS